MPWLGQFRPLAIKMIREGWIDGVGVGPHLLAVAVQIGGVEAEGGGRRHGDRTGVGGIRGAARPEAVIGGGTTAAGAVVTGQGHVLGRTVGPHDWGGSGERRDCFSVRNSSLQEGCKQCEHEKTAPKSGQETGTASSPEMHKPLQVSKKARPDVVRQACRYQIVKNAYL